MIVGERLRNLREEFGYTREVFATKVGIGASQVVRYERGENDATGEVLSRIARLFGVSTDYLLGLTDESVSRLHPDLSIQERRIVLALRRGERMEAVKIIATEDGEYLDETQDCAGV